jgi:CHAP domain
MRPGTSIRSNNQCFRLDAQTDGNLVLYNVPAQKAIWNSGTNGRSVKHTVFQNDGNLVIYDTNNSPIWNTGPRAGATRFTVQDDGNFVMYNSQGQALAATNTNQPCGNITSPDPVKPPINTSRESKIKANRFVSSWLGQTGIKRLNTNVLQGQCVTLVVRYLQDYYQAPIDPPGGLSNISWGDGKSTAFNVGNVYLKDKFFPVSDPNPPIPGSIISFPNHPYSPTYGHVALVIDSQKNGNNLIVTILESNTDGQPTAQSKVTSKKIVLDIRNPSNVSAQGHGNGIYWVNPRD